MAWSRTDISKVTGAKSAWIQNQTAQGVFRPAETRVGTGRTRQYGDLEAEVVSVVWAVEQDMHLVIGDQQGLANGVRLLLRKGGSAIDRARASKRDARNWLAEENVRLRVIPRGGNKFFVFTSDDHSAIEATLEAYQPRLSFEINLSLALGLVHEGREALDRNA